MTTEPWAHVSEPGSPATFYDTPAGLPGVLPGDLARWQREEARAHAEERRVEEERAERADLRQTHALFAARQHALHRGLEWDPRRPFEHWPSVYDRADMLFQLQDAETRRDERRAAKEVGLEHLLPGLVGELSPPPVVEPAGDPQQPPASRAFRMASAPVPAAAARANPVGTRIRAAFTRWASPKTGHRSGPAGCGCAACRANATVRSNDGSRPLNGPETVRYR